MIGLLLANDLTITECCISLSSVAKKKLFNHKVHSENSKNRKILFISAFSVGLNKR